MKRISAYQATDGQVFRDKVKCKEHQKNLNIIAAVEKVAAKFDPSVGSNVTGDPIALFIIEHAEEIKAALEGKTENVAASDATEVASQL